MGIQYERLLDLDLPPKQSAFLWGARKTGKSTYLKRKFGNSVYYDLLKSDLFLHAYPDSTCVIFGFACTQAPNALKNIESGS